MEVLPIRRSGLACGLVAFAWGGGVEDGAVRGVCSRCCRVRGQPCSQRAGAANADPILRQLTLNDASHIAVELELPRPRGQIADAGETGSEDLIGVCRHVEIGGSDDLVQLTIQQGSNRDGRVIGAALAKCHRSHRHTDDPARTGVDTDPWGHARGSGQQEASSGRVIVDRSANAVPNTGLELPLIDQHRRW